MTKAHPSEPQGRDPVELLLRRIARVALRGSLLGGTALSAGCTTPNEPEVSPAIDPGTPPFEDARVSVDPRAGGSEAIPAEAIDICARGAGFPVQATGLVLAKPVDYLAVREVVTRQHASSDAGVESEVWTNPNFTVTSERGAPCATATSDACTSQIATHPESTSQSYCPQACVEWSLVTTRGDRVERWDAPEELLSLLGSIDSPDDALVLVASHGYNVMCESPDSPLSDGQADLRWVRMVAGGYELLATQYADTCPVVVRRFHLFVSNAGVVRVLSSKDFSGTGVCIGRVPEGLTSRSVLRAESVLGDHLAHCAHLEAASVHAFLRLADELRAFQAPSDLIERALAAADDEVRHSQSIGALALSNRGQLTTPEVRRLPTRTLEQVALENAVEGCVRETYGAVVGAYQAARAGDQALRHAMQEIAADEARHAALSHALDVWLMEKLDPAAQQRVNMARTAALEELFVISGSEPDAELRTLAGLPTAQTARAMVAALARELWNVELASAA